MIFVGEGTVLSAHLCADSTKENDVSNDPHVQAMYIQGGPNSATANNIGLWQASQNLPCAPQQYNEPHVLYEQRLGTYNHTKNSGY
jgi:hypothetical protein